MKSECGLQWTNTSVLDLTDGSDPFEVLTTLAKELVLDAVEHGWEGPPFDPFQLAELRHIEVVPREDILDAQSVPVSAGHVRIEFNPLRSRARTRFSIAHEIAHTLFPDHSNTVRERLSKTEASPDEWQLELLCNIAAAEILMPVGLGLNLESEPLTINNVANLRKKYEVSMEAMLLRLVKLTDNACVGFVASPLNGRQHPTPYRIDYSLPSRSMSIRIPYGLNIGSDTAAAECTAVDFTSQGTETWSEEWEPFLVECVGIPPYPGDRLPRVLGILKPTHVSSVKVPSITTLWGDATEPRGKGRRLVAHIVNDRTPNWGAGFARAVASKWPHVQQKFRSWVDSDRTHLRLGNIYQSSATDDLSLVQLIAQHSYGTSKPGIRYVALKNCLDQLANFAINRGASVHMPRIGTGEAGGNWAVIKELIYETLVSKGVETTVYVLPSDEPPREVQGVLGLFSEPAER